MQWRIRKIKNARGFSLAELMVIVVIIGILSGVTIVVTGNQWRRERVNSAVIEFAGWLEQVRNASLRQTSVDPSSGGCEVSVNVGALSSGQVLASVSPARCSPESSFRLPGLVSQGNSFNVAVSNATPFTFTPRGSVILPSNDADGIVGIHLDGSGLARCVRIGVGLGAIRIGANNSASGATTSCVYSRF